MNSDRIRYETNPDNLPKYAERATLHNAGYFLLTAEEANHLQAARIVEALAASGVEYTHVAGGSIDDTPIVYAGFSDRWDAAFTRIL